jgi:hypothetical protein
VWEQSTILFSRSSVVGNTLTNNGVGISLYNADATWLETSPGKDARRSSISSSENRSRHGTTGRPANPADTSPPTTAKESIA